jgi:hypothetical protein
MMRTLATPSMTSTLVAVVSAAQDSSLDSSRQAFRNGDCPTSTVQGRRVRRMSLMRSTRTPALAVAGQHSP